MFTPHRPRPAAAVNNRLLFSVFALFALLLCSGCVTSKKYRLAKTDTPPAKILGWSATSADLDARLDTVIVFKGPGSWKREARWDEYVVTLSNPGSQPIVIEKVVLIDILGEPQRPGTDPWKLEKLSYTNWDRYGKTGLKLLAGAGVVAVYVGATSAAVMGAAMSGGAAGGAGLAAATFIPVVALIDIGVVAVMNHDLRHKVEAEFSKRRLNEQQQIAPGQHISGSYFFPMTPSPKRLIISGHKGDAPVEIVIDLQGLADLHLKPK